MSLNLEWYSGLKWRPMNCDKETDKPSDVMHILQAGHSTHYIAELSNAATPWRPANLQPLGGTEVGCKMGLWRLASSEPALLSPDTLLCLLTFCFTGFVIILSPSGLVISPCKSDLVGYNLYLSWAWFLTAMYVESLRLEKLKLCIITITRCSEK